MRRIAVALLAASVAASVFGIQVGGPATASVGGLVAINELMPSPEVDDGEFLELRNVTSTSVDVGGWCFTEGISGCLPAGTTIGPDAFLLMVQDAAIARAAWGIPSEVPVYEYSGGQSGGGELIRLEDANGTVADEVVYSDEPPWDASYDDGDASLERIDPSVGSSNPGNWAGSDPAPTPGSENSVYDPGSGPLLEIVTAVAAPARPEPSEPIVVTATVNTVAEAVLTYVVGFGSPVEVPMTTVDGVGFEAVIPGQDAGVLVRYRVDAGSAEGTAGWPAVGASVDYDGVVVTNPAVDSPIPVLEWFMDDAVYQDLLAHHRYDDVTGPAVIAYDGRVWDNVSMRVRGGFSRTFQKVSWKVEFPDGQLFTMPGIDEPLDEFNLQRDQWPHPEISWDLVDAAGHPAVDYVFVRQQRNGEFHGIGAVLEPMDGRWRDRHGYDDDDFYDVASSGLEPLATEEQARTGGHFEKKEGDPDDFSDIQELTLALAEPAGPEQLAWIHDTFDVPALINYLAVIELLRHADSMRKNYSITRDGDTGRWELLHWDLDHAFRRVEVTSPAYPFVGQLIQNMLYRRVLEYDDLRAMFHRRVRTLHDEILVSTALEDEFAALVESLDGEYVDELAMWPQPPLLLWLGLYGEGPAEVVADMRATHADIRSTVAAQTALGVVPPAQAANPSVHITEIHYRPDDGSDAEFVELHNPGETAVDISGWSITGGIERTFRPGTVIPSGGYLVTVNDDDGFTASLGGGVLVGGEFQGNLSNSGEQVELRNRSGSIVEWVAYATGPGWPDLDDGSSLERIDVGLPSESATSWAPSPTGASPGLASTAQRLPLLVPGAAGIAEGDVGSVFLDIPVVLSRPSSETVRAAWYTLDLVQTGIAAAEVDFVAGTGTVEFLPGETEQHVTIEVLGDVESEPPFFFGEWILVRFEGHDRAEADTGGFFGHGVGVVLDDD